MSALRCQPMIKQGLNSNTFSQKSICILFMCLYVRQGSTFKVEGHFQVCPGFYFFLGLLIYSVHARSLSQQCACPNHKHTSVYQSCWPNPPLSCPRWSLPLTIPRTILVLVFWFLVDKCAHFFWERTCLLIEYVYV